MSYRWRWSLGPETCGAAPGCVIGPEQPVCEVWPYCPPDTPNVKPLLRCQTHASAPLPVDMGGTPDPFEGLELEPEPKPVPASGMTLLANARPPRFDAKMAAAGKDDDE